MFKMQRTARMLRDSIVDYLHFLLILPNKERQLGNTNNIKVAYLYTIDSYSVSMGHPSYLHSVLTTVASRLTTRLV